MAHIVLDGNGVQKYIFSTGAGTSDDPYILVANSLKDSSIAAGKVFAHADLHTVANNNEFTYLLKTPVSGNVNILQISIITTSSPITITLYEDSVVSSNGTTESFYNANRRSSSSPDTLIYEQPTVTGWGTARKIFKTTGTKDTGDKVQFGFVPLDLLSNYTLRIQNTSGFSSDISIEIMILEE